MEVKPTAKCNSRNLAWQFSILVFPKEAVNAEVGKALGDRIRASANTDHDTGTVTQPYRIAGTINYPTAEKKKRGRVVVPTRLIEVAPILWTPEDIKEAFPPLERRSNGNGSAHEMTPKGSRRAIYLPSCCR